MQQTCAMRMIEVCLLTFLAKDSATAENTDIHTTQDTYVTATYYSVLKNFHVSYRTKLSSHVKLLIALLTFTENLLL